MKEFGKILTLLMLIVCGIAFVYYTIKGEKIDAIMFMCLFIINELTVINNKE